MGLFSEIPRHNQLDILKKLDFEKFVEFKQCSKETVKLTKHFKHPLYLKVNAVNYYYQFTIRKNGNDYELEYAEKEPVRLKVENFNVYSKMPEEQFEFLEEFCHKKKLFANVLHMNAGYEEHKNEPSIIDKLIELLKVDTLNTCLYPSSDVLSLSELNNIEHLIFTYGTMEESDFLRLEQPKIEFFDLDAKGLTSTAINKFLKQWTEDKREIKLFSCDIFLDFEELFKDLERSLLWSPESNESSCFDFSWTQEKDANLLKIHSLERKKDGKRIIVVICEHYFDHDVHFIRVKQYLNTGEIEEFVRSYCDYN